MCNEDLYFLQSDGRYLFGFYLTRYDYRACLYFVSHSCDAMRFTLDCAKSVITLISIYRPSIKFRLVPVEEV